MKTEQEIEAELELADEQNIENESKWPGMTYEEGVAAALGWVLERGDGPPMSE